MPDVGLNARGHRCRSYTGSDSGQLIEFQVNDWGSAHRELHAMHKHNPTRSSGRMLGVWQEREGPGEVAARSSAGLHAVHAQPCVLAAVVDCEVVPGVSLWKKFACKDSLCA